MRSCRDRHVRDMAYISHGVVIAEVMSTVRLFYSPISFIRRARTVCSVFIRVAARPLGRPPRRSSSFRPERNEKVRKMGRREEELERG